MRSAIETLGDSVAAKGYVCIDGKTTKNLLQSQPGALGDLVEFTNSWSNLCLDQYMADGGTYRKRRHSVFSCVPASRAYRLEKHQPHFQTVHYNPLNGGVARYYQPIEQSVLQGKSLASCLSFGCDILVVYRLTLLGILKYISFVSKLF